ncbi:MAG: hypothetical protein DRJ49_05265 [Thermoprotei archaeon]|nr:MAG: hypothetical protein DRJ49_05265 [Thermoprotei archaeon]
MSRFVKERIRIYLEDAREFIEEAFEEFEKGVHENNTARIRDSAEKAWNAVIQASNALILKYTDRVPSSHWERRRLLRELEKVHPEIEKMGFRDRYSARERNLHELVFYEGIIDIEDIRVELEKARKFIKDVEKLV